MGLNKKCYSNQQAIRLIAKKYEASTGCVRLRLEKIGIIKKVRN